MSLRPPKSPKRVSDEENQQTLGASSSYQNISFHGYLNDDGEPELTTSPRDFSTRDLNIELVNKSLADVNNFSSARKTEKQSTIMMYEITTDGESNYKEMTLRELLNYVNKESAAIDARAEAKRQEKIRLYQEAQSLLSSQSSDTTGGIHLAMSPPITPLSGLHIPQPSNAGINSMQHNLQHHPQNPQQQQQQSVYTVDTAYPVEEVFNAVSELRLRDLRRLDYQFNPNEEKSVLIRRHAVLFAMDPMRAVVMTNRLILIVPPGADSLIDILDKYMREWTLSNNKLFASSQNLAGLAGNPHIQVPASANSNGNSNLQQQTEDASRYKIPFESHAYEALITTVKSMETQEFDNVSVSLREILAYCSHGALLPIEIQEKMRNLKNDLSKMASRVASSQHALLELTEDDEEMALMNLTHLRQKPRLYTYPLSSEILCKHDEIEELLESYLLDFNALAANIEYARSQIQSAEELVSLRLDTSRNELLIANTALSILACSIGFGAYLAGVFGMNLDNVEYLQPVKGGFAGLFAGTFILIPIGCVLICEYMRFTKMLPNGLDFHKPFAQHKKDRGGGRGKR